MLNSLYQTRESKEVEGQDSEVTGWKHYKSCTGLEIRKIQEHNHTAMEALQRDLILSHFSRSHDD